MEKVHLIGRVYPEAFQVNARMPDLAWKWEARNIELLFRVVINHSFVNLECHLEVWRPEYFVEIYRRALDLARSATNLIAFTTGYGLSVSLETLILPDGVTSTIAPVDPAVPSLCTAYALTSERHADFDAVSRIVLGEPPLFLALNDLIDCIKIPHVASTNCGRVIDSICRMITPAATAAKGPNAQAWHNMQEALNISEPYQRWISEQATGPRHADPAFVPGTITTEVARRTWTVMSRFLEYRKRGNLQLTAPEFPNLS